jgi:hypothetical protein
MPTGRSSCKLHLPLQTGRIAILFPLGNPSFPGGYLRPLRHQCHRLLPRPSSALPNTENKAAQEPTPRPAETATPTSKYPSECQLLSSSFCRNFYTVGKFPKPTFFEVSLGCKSSSRVQRTSDYQSKVGFPYTLDRSPEVVGSRRGLNREPKLYR